MRKVVALVHSFDCSELLIVPTSNNQVHVYSQQNILSKIDQQSIETSLLPRKPSVLVLGLSSVGAMNAT